MRLVAQTSNLSAHPRRSTTQQKPCYTNCTASALSMSSPELDEPRRKRVRFAESPEVRVFQPDPAGAAGTGNAGIVSSDADEPSFAANGQPTSTMNLEPHTLCVSGSDIAAAEAARRRRHMRWMTAAEDMSVLEELEEAEEGYDEPDELFTSDGIPIEPFHLRRERAEGFFDGEGNYVEYRLEPVSDAWLDSLGDGPVDMSLAVLAAGGSAAGDEGAALDEDDAAIYKKRIADLLLPGETVLLALRRLGRRSGLPLASSPTAAAAAARRHRRAKRQQQQEQQRNGAEASLQQQEQQQDDVGGQQPAHADKQQQQQQDQPQGSPTAAAAAAAAAPAASSPVVATPPKVNPISTSSSSSSPGQPGTAAAAAAAAAAGVTGQGLGGSPGKTPHPGALKTAAALAGIPAENRAAFDRLTEYADILLTNGDVNIYTASRETLLQQLDIPGLTVMLGEVGGDVDLDLDVRPQKQAGRKERQGPAAAAAAAAAAGAAAASKLVAAAGGERSGQKEQGGAAGQSTEAAPVTDDADVDMFAEEDENPAAAAAAAGRKPSQQPITAQPQQQAEGPQAAAGPEANPSPAAAAAAAAAVVDADGDEAMEDAVGTPTAAAAAGGGGGGGSSGSSSGTVAAMAAGSAMDGFVLDESSGCYYSSTLGYYFDPKSQLFGDASSGQWYRYVEETGSYQLVESA